MILCIDVGNTQMHAGVYDGNLFVTHFRKTTRQSLSSDEMGIFLRTAIKENNFNPDSIMGITICSVVPDLNHSLRSGCIKYFNIEPFFLKAGTKTGLKIKYKNPLEVGSDRIANAIGAIDLFPDRNIIVIDFGTATTFCAISKTKEYLGGVIIPGVRISMEVLVSKTAQLPAVEIKKPDSVLGKSTIESIQSGLFNVQVGTARELKNKIASEVFNNDEPVIIGTGGFSALFESEKIFDLLYPNLVLKGLLLAYYQNQKRS